MTGSLRSTRPDDGLNNPGDCVGLQTKTPDYPCFDTWFLSCGDGQMDPLIGQSRKRTRRKASGSVMLARVSVLLIGAGLSSCAPCRGDAPENWRSYHRGGPCFLSLPAYPIRTGMKKEASPHCPVQPLVKASALRGMVMVATQAQGPDSAQQSLITSGTMDELQGSRPLPPLLAFPGGGIYFYWQAGAYTYLRERMDLSSALLCGASAGSLTAVLGACDVDMSEAAEAALGMSLRIGLWKRPLGLAGVWGGLVEKWLHDLLPTDAATRCNDRVHIHVTKPGLPGRKGRGRLQCYSRVCLYEFEDREALVEACVASTHIPFFMDGKPLKRLRRQTRAKGLLVLDGSFLQSNHELLDLDTARQGRPFKLHTHAPTPSLEPQGEEGWAITTGEGRVQVLLDHSRDEALGRQGGLDFVTLTSPCGIKQLMRLGYAYARRQDEAGHLEALRQSLQALRQAAK